MAVNVSLSTLHHPLEGDKLSLMKVILRLLSLELELDMLICLMMNLIMIQS
jgi:hypothetical protein